MKNLIMILLTVSLFSCSSEKFSFSVKASKTNPYASKLSGKSPLNTKGPVILVVTKATNKKVK